jgi:Skp family chaperone for outer membrane proteins
VTKDHQLTYFTHTFFFFFFLLMKLKQYLFVALAVFGFGAVAHAQKAAVVLTIDIQEVYKNYAAATDAETKFQSAVENARTQEEDMKKELITLRDQIRDMMAKSQSDAINEATRTELETEIDTQRQNFASKNEELRNFQQETTKFLQDRLQTIRNHHISEIREEARSIAEEKNADMVLNSAGLGAVIYAAEGFSITDLCIERLNANAPELEVAE